MTREEIEELIDELEEKADLAGWQAEHYRDRERELLSEAKTLLCQLEEDDECLQD